ESGRGSGGDTHQATRELSEGRSRTHQVEVRRSGESGQATVSRAGKEGRAAHGEGPARNNLEPADPPRAVPPGLSPPGPQPLVSGRHRTSWRLQHALLG